MERATPLDLVPIVLASSCVRNGLEIVKYKETERTTKCRQMEIRFSALYMLSARTPIINEDYVPFNMYDYWMNSLKAYTNTGRRSEHNGTCPLIAIFK
jgi:hypothetical protein